jgi:hypothetical protein
MPIRSSECSARSTVRAPRPASRTSWYGDCEAADRAGKYLRAGLDVWGFATWQVKHFPVDNYRGATLERCRGIKSVVASSVDLQSAIARQAPPEP